MEKEEITALGKVSDAITNEPIYFKFEVKPQNRLEKALASMRLFKSKRVFELRPLSVGNRIRASKMSVKIPKELFNGGVKEALLNGEHAESLIYVVALGMQNDRFPPKQSLMDLIRWNFDDTDIARALEAIFAQIDIQAFIKSMVLLKGSEILQTPPQQETSL